MVRRMSRISSYLISLDEPTKKLDYLRSRGVDPILINAVDGKDYVNGKIGVNGISVSPNFFKWGPYSVIGCAMSHMKTWSTFLRESSSNYAVIMEDDVVLVDDFPTRFDEVMKSVPSDFDVLYLGTLGSEGGPNLFSIFSNIIGTGVEERRINDKIKIPRIVFGNHAYVVSRSGAEKLLRELNGKVYFHIDYCMQELFSRGITRVYAASPRIAYQTSTDTGESTNISSAHPVLLSHLLSTIHIDKMVRGDYPLRVSVMRIGNTILNASSFIFIILGCVFAIYKVDPKLLLVTYLVVSMPDIVIAMTEGGSNIVLLHAFLFLLPSFITSQNKSFNILR